MSANDEPSLTLHHTTHHKLCLLANSTCPTLLQASLKAVPALPNGWVPRMPTELISDAIEPSSPAMHYFVNWQRTLPAVVGSDDEETLEAVCRERGLVRQRL